MMNANKIMNGYNNTDKAYLIRTMQMMAIFGGKAPETEEEFGAWCDETLTDRDKKIAEEKAKADKKANKELAKAEELGMTLEEYKEYKKAVAQKKRHETEIRKAYEEIERMKRRIAYEEKRVAEYEEKIKKMEK